MRAIRLVGNEEERFWPKVEPRGDCWIWTAATNNLGYGIFLLSNGTNVRAHRWAYENLVGPVPQGLVLDHICRVRNCVNPDHLDPVTQGQNLHRGAVEARRVWKLKSRTHCLRGHPYTPESTYIDNRGRRSCLICRRSYRERSR